VDALVFGDAYDVISGHLTVDMSVSVSPGAIAGRAMASTSYQVLWFSGTADFDIGFEYP
jgi:hypothetical protein